VWRTYSVRAALGERRRHVFGDDDGVLFVAGERFQEVLATAQQIWQTEREKARGIHAGETLRQQTAFDDYLVQNAGDP
jgi:4-hydroxy-4-methyl-2-oxoglutarate aldolase